MTSFQVVGFLMQRIIYQIIKIVTVGVDLNVVES